jgi:hypothetical protein
MAKDKCQDFAQVTEDCMPLGAAYYDGDLVLQPEHFLTTAEWLEILNAHPYAILKNR